MRADDPQLRSLHLLRHALPHARGTAVVAGLAVLGIGNAWRGDDAAGIVAAERLRERLQEVEVVACEGEPVGLMDALEGADAVWIVDAVSSGAPAGTVHRLDLAERELPHELFRASTHAFGVAESLELARALGKLPERVVVYGIEGGAFSAGVGLTTEVERAVGQVVESIAKEVESCTSGR